MHRQGDPSCTYLETLSCGVPIVGYENIAFSGLLQKADVGWGVDINNVIGIADIIESLDANRALIKSKSLIGFEYSCAHDFESTFKNRVKHLQELTE